MDDFTNLAGIKEADEHIRKELHEAGIPRIAATGKGEVPYNLEGDLRGWRFERLWRYWGASHPQGLPLNIADALHTTPLPVNAITPYSTHEGEKQYGDVIRVAGDCTCPSPKERLTNGCVTSYHIDTQEGLNEFVKAIGGRDFNWDKAIYSYRINRNSGGNTFIEKFGVKTWCVRISKSYLCKSNGEFKHKADIACFVIENISDGLNDHIFESKEAALQCHQEYYNYK